MPYRYVCRMKGWHKISFGKLCFINYVHINVAMYNVHIAMYVRMYVAMFGRSQKREHSSYTVV